MLVRYLGINKPTSDQKSIKLIACLLSPVHGGAWSTEGCWLESSTKEYTICRCDHLANFAVLMDAVDSGSMQVRYFVLPCKMKMSLKQ